MFTSLEHYKLMGHQVSVYEVMDELVCASHCLRTCRCQSFNLKKRPNGRFLCHLNNVSKNDFPDDFVFANRERYIYYERV